MLQAARTRTRSFAVARTRRPNPQGSNMKFAAGLRAFLSICENNQRIGGVGCYVPLGLRYEITIVNQAHNSITDLTGGYAHLRAHARARTRVYGVQRGVRVLCFSKNRDIHIHNQWLENLTLRITPHNTPLCFGRTNKIGGGYGG
jgi:hypothetical protein